MKKLFSLLWQHKWGILLIVALLIGSNFAVKAWKEKHPGAMSVLESQAMDMTVMKPPVGAVPVATEIVHLGRFAGKVTYTGSVAPFQEQVVYPRVEGYLKNLTVYNGDRVSTNQLIATVDSPDLQSKVAEAAAGQAAAASEVPTAQYGVAQMSAEKAAAQGDVRTAQSELARARAMVTASQKGVTQRQKEVKSAKAEMDYQAAELARDRKLLGAGAVSMSEFQARQAEATAAEAEYENKLAMLDEARADVEAARAEVNSKQSMVSVANQRVAAASAAVAGAGSEVRQKAAMARQAGAMVNTAATINQYRYVRAPFSGTVTKRYVSPGQFVTPSTALASIVQMDRVRLQANVADKDIENIKVGAPVTARFPKDSKLSVQARVTSVSPLSDQSSRTAVVEAMVPNPGHKLTPGDAVTMEITVSGNPDAISVPMSAVVQKDGMPAVWVARAEAAKGKAEYYCTMHPEVVQDHPGDCPKCNMKLVPRTSDGNKKAHLVMVSTGASSGDRIAVTSGLSDGDEVIYQGNTYLKEGDAVFPTQWSEDGPKEMPAAPGMGDMPGMDHGNMPAPASPQQGGGHEGHQMKGETGTEPCSQVQPTAPAQAGKQLYQCPMHPDQTSTNPEDECKLCGMKINEPVKK